MVKTAKRFIFIGRVQGVGFRFTAFNIAKRSEITGYVKNTPDGSVEMLAQGYPQDIKDCIDDIKETFQGSIRKITEDQIELDNSLTEFKITF